MLDLKGKPIVTHNIDVYEKEDLRNWTMKVLVLHVAKA
jgi:hypothetical protein